MINPISRALNKPQRLNFYDTTKFQSHAVSALIITNAILRPTATELDTSTPKKDRDYSAAREFFHQSMCLACHLMLSPLFEKIAFHVAKRIPALKKEFGEFKTFKDVGAAINGNAEARRHNRLIGAKFKEGVELPYKEIPRALSGVLRLGSTMGTIVALAYVAPTINNHLLKPILKALHLESSEDKNKGKDVKDKKKAS